MLAFTNTDTLVCISVCASVSAYPRVTNAILSTKYFDDETELAYYGFRYYSPEMGRWLSRDPIGEWGGICLYMFTGNDPVHIVDYLGELGMAFSEPSVGKCGYFEGAIDIGPARGDGWIIQEVVSWDVGERWHKDDKGCCDYLMVEIDDRDHFFEAFDVTTPQNLGEAAMRTLVASDATTGKDYGDCSWGGESRYKRATFYADPDVRTKVSQGQCPFGFQIGEVNGEDPTGTGSTCWRWAQNYTPPGWENRMGAPSLVAYHHIEASWDCMVGRFRTDTDVLEFGPGW